MSYTYRYQPAGHEPHEVEGFGDNIRMTCVGRAVEVEVGIGGRRRYIEFRVLDLWRMSVLRGETLCVLDTRIEKPVERKFIFLDDRPDLSSLEPAVDAIRAAKAVIDLLDDAHYVLLFRLREEVAEFCPEWIAFIDRVLAASAAESPVRERAP